MWTNPLTLGTIASLAVLTAIVNARFVLMSASLRPWLGPLPAWQAYPSLLLTTDATWIVGMRYRAEGGGDASIYLGAGLAIWAVWVASVIPGYLLGAFIADPKRFGFDLMLPIFFAAMLVQIWRGAAPRGRLGGRGRRRARRRALDARLVVHRHRRGRRQHRRRFRR